MVVTEALARGLPVIATAVGGLPEALGRTSDGRRPGLLVPPDDSDALAAALRSWLTDADLRQRLREAARERRRTLSGWEAPTDRIAGSPGQGRGMTAAHWPPRHECAGCGPRHACWAVPRSWRSSCRGWAPARSCTDCVRSAAGRWPRRPASRSSRRCAPHGDGASSPAASASRCRCAPRPRRTTGRSSSTPCCRVVCSVTSTEQCAMAATPAMSAVVCGPSPGNAPPGRLSSWRSR